MIFPLAQSLLSLWLTAERDPRDRYAAACKITKLETLQNKIMLEATARLQIKGIPTPYA